jgi:hypothetical protein
LTVVKAEVLYGVFADYHGAGSGERQILLRVALLPGGSEDHVRSELVVGEKSSLHPSGNSCREFWQGILVLQLG